MLKELFIQNYAIIDELTMNFGPTLNIITGETGAGKSILTGALGLVLGNRADTKVLYNESKKCIVEAKFSTKTKNITALLNSEEIEQEDLLIIRRIINTSGKSRAFVNDVPVNLSFLRQLNDYLVDMHRQFDTLGINNNKTQIAFLDAVGDNENVLQKYSDVYRQFRKDSQQLQQLIEEEHRIQQELDFIQFQYVELEEANFQEGEQKEIEEELSILENAEALTQILQKSNYQIYDSEHNVVSQLEELIQEMNHIDASIEDFIELLNRLESTKEELIDIASESDRLSGKFDVDTSELSTKQERLSLLYRLLKKHNAEDLQELLSIQNDFSNQIEDLQGFEKNKTELENHIAQQQKELEKYAAQLHESRVKGSKKLTGAVLSILSKLGMEHAELQIHIDKTDEFYPTGMDQVQYLFSANPGKTPESLDKVASGGELSRLALAIKSTIAGNVELPTLIFDEIDTGISGEVASKMGIILRSMSEKHQLIVITHSPQISATADKHFYIYKTVESNRTFTKVKELEKEERVVEIAKMLSGDPPPITAIENAKQLIQSE